MTAWLADRMLVVIPLVLSLSVHEYAHAWAAARLGDDTARLGGRMTLDPLAHIDPIGTLIFPLLGVPIGWAKPVPVNPNRFRLSINPVLGMALVAGAGPASNFVLALLAFGVREILPAGALGTLANTLVAMNVALGLFNLLPIPPLDGSRVLALLVPDSLQGAWETFGRFSIVFVVAIGFVAWGLFELWRMAVWSEVLTAQKR